MASFLFAEGIAVNGFPLSAATADDALQAAICRLASLFAAAHFLLSEPFATAACFRDSHQRVLGCPALIDTRQAAPSYQGSRTRSPSTRP